MKQFIYTGELKKVYPDAMLKTGLITKSEYNKIDAYLAWSNAAVYFAADKGFVIDTPEITITHKSKKSFMNDVNYNLECIKELFADREADGKSSEY